MKKMLPFLLILISTHLLHAQVCGRATEFGVFQANDIHTFFNAEGYKFNILERRDPIKNGFTVPFIGTDSPISLYSSNSWIGGYDENNELRFSGETFNSQNRYPFTPGPITKNDDGTIAPYCSTDFDNLWTVTSAEVQNHIDDFAADGKIDNPIPNIFGWPADGNAQFELYNGFKLPENHHGGWAEFSDINKNGIYEPDQGEYPHVQINNQSTIPNQIMWMVYNDLGGFAGNWTAQDHNMKMEFQLTAYGFTCSDFEALNKTIFTRTKLINQSNQDYTDFRFSELQLAQLGYFFDDYMGTDTSLNSIFHYNNDPFDGPIDSSLLSSFGTPRYSEAPPAQSFTFLNHDLFASTAFHNSDPELEPVFLSPQTTSQFYNFQNGLLRTGHPMCAEQSGYCPGDSSNITKFIYTGKPGTDQWTNYDSDRHFHLLLGSFAIPNFKKDSIVVVDAMYTHHQNDSLDNIEVIDLMQSNILDLTSWYEEDGTCTQIVEQFCTDQNCVWPGDFDANGKVEFKDILFLGHTHNMTGTTRSNNLMWRGHSSEDWQVDIPTASNMKHVDGNADGRVDSIDFYIHEYYLNRTNQHYIPEPDRFDLGPEILIKPGQPSITLLDDQFVVFVETGTEINNLHGIYFEIEYDSSLLDKKLPFSHNIFNQTENYLIEFRTVLELKSPEIPYYCVLKDVDSEMVAEERRFFSLRFTRKIQDIASIPDSMELIVKNILAIDKSGNKLNVGAQNLTLYKNPTTTSSSSLGKKSKTITIYPNPAKEFIQVQSKELLKEVKVFDVSGKIILSKENLLDKSSLIDVSGIQPGIYFLKASFKGASVTEKIVIN